MPKGRRCFFSHHCGPWHHAYSGYGAPPWAGGTWYWRRPAPEEERQALDDYIDALKEELQEAEAYRKELEGHPPS